MTPINVNQARTEDSSFGRPTLPPGAPSTNRIDTFAAEKNFIGTLGRLQRIIPDLAKARCEGLSQFTVFETPMPSGSRRSCGALMPITALLIGNPTEAIPTTAQGRSSQLDAYLYVTIAPDEWVELT